MHRRSGQRGAGLILLIGITAALAVLAASTVMLLANQQGATARERSSKTSMYFAEAALNSAIAAVKGTNTWRSTAFSDSAAMTAMAANYDTLPAGRPTVVYRVYDDAAAITPTTPAWDQNANTKVWVEVSTTYQGRTTRVRQMVAAVTTSLVEHLPKAAAFCGGAGASDNVTMSTSGDVYAARYTSWPATNANGIPYTGGAPFQTAIMAKGTISGSATADLALGTGRSNPQSLGVQANVGVSLPGVAGNGNPTIGGVPDLTTYLSLSDQLALEQEARSILDADQQAKFKPNGNGTVYTTRTALLSAPGVTYNSGTKTYTSTVDLVFTGTTLTLDTAGTTYNFKCLWVNGNLTLGSTTTTHTTALRVSGDFTISGPTSTNTFGPVYVIGDVNWGGAATVKTTDYLDSNAEPAPMWIGGVFTRDGGPFNDEYGDVFVVFQVNFRPSIGHSTVLCPLLATTERITTSGDIDFGTMATSPPRPMTLYMVCDNDGLYTQTCNWGSTGQFYGLMIMLEAGIDLQNGNASKPAVVGSVLTIGGDNGLEIMSNAQIAYCQDVIDSVFLPITSTSTITQTVAGTWQELSPN
jgi:Tfp pilus assembly protein PilX